MRDFREKRVTQHPDSRDRNQHLLSLHLVPGAVRQTVLSVPYRWRN